MEPDRYQKNHTLFLVGMISLMVGLILLLLSLYLLPNLLFGWQYSTPIFVTYVNEWLRATYEIPSQAAAKIIFLVLLGLSLIFIVVAYFSSNRLENEIYQDELGETEQPIVKKEEPSEGKSLTLKILLIIFAIFVLGTLFEWLINNNSPDEENEIIQPTNTNNETVDGT